MSAAISRVLRRAALGFLFLASSKLQAEYLHILLKIYGLDCELCARGVSASVARLDGVESVKVSVKTGLLEISLKPGNTFKIKDLRKRIRQNGFRAMEATVTADGRFEGSRFEVDGAGEFYDLGRRSSEQQTAHEVTFDIR